jgi:mono/diheme cytochrome c family protein/glucose/arabinose dehydrogenase
MTRLASFSLATALLAAAALVPAAAVEDMPPPPAWMKVPPAPVVPPKDAIATLKVQPGFKVELVASEPLIRDPVQISFDGAGRMWVVEMCGYMPDSEGTGEDQPNGRIVVLEDTDGDGVMDKSTTFIEGLVLPRSLCLVGDGALIAEPPHLWYCRDTDGDLKSDTKVEVFSDYGKAGGPEHTANGLMPGLDNWIYSANHAMRYRFAGGKWTEEKTAPRGQWGISQDDVGRLFHNSNSDQLRCDVLCAEELLRNPDLHAPSGLNVQVAKDQSVWPIRVNPGVNRGYKAGQLRPQNAASGVPGSLATFTAVCAPVVYRGDLLEGCLGDVFIAEPSGNIVRRAVVKESGFDLTTGNAYDKQEFIASTDERFRPVNFANGPDGSLYMVDMYHGALQHRIFVTPYLRKQMQERGLEKPLGLGRIYRIVPDGKPAPRVRPTLAKAGIDELVGHLSDAGGWWRDTAQRLLVERADAAAVPKLRALATGGPQPLGRMHALWTLDGLGDRDPATLGAALGDQDGRVRAAALRIAEALFTVPAGAPLLAKACALAKDPEPRVRLQAAMGLGLSSDPKARAALQALLLADGGSAYVRDAALSGLGGREVEFLAALLGAEGWNATTKPAGADAVIAGLATCVAYEGRPERLGTLLTLAVAQTAPWRQSAILDGVAAAKGKNAKRGSLTADGPPAGWDKLAASKDAKVKARAAELGEWISWHAAGTAVAAKTVAAPHLDAAQMKRFESGKARYLGLCAACHQPTGLGLGGLAPPLADSEWVTGSEQRTVRIVLNGVGGPITSNGVTFTTEMPPLGAALDDTAIAEILTYVRNEWGNQAPPVEAATVKSIRAAMPNRGAWTVEELEKLP